MNEIIYPKSKTWFIASSNTAYSLGEISEYQCLATGLDCLEVFDDISLYTARLLELGLDPET